MKEACLHNPADRSSSYYIYNKKKSFQYLQYRGHIFNLTKKQKHTTKILTIGRVSTVPVTVNTRPI